MYIVAISNHFSISNTKSSIFLFAFYNAQKLPHQGSYRAIQNNLHHYHQLPSIQAYGQDTPREAAASC